MKIQFIGTGGPFDHKLTNSSALVTIGDKEILIDCGHSVFPALKSKGLEASMDYLLITHTHDDHVGSLASLILYAYFEHQKTLTLLYPTESFLNHLKGYLSFVMGDADKYLNYLPLSDFEGVDFIETSQQHVSYLQSFAFIFENKSKRILFSGDTSNPHCLFDELRKLSEKPTTLFHDLSFGTNPTHTHYKDLIPYLSEFTIYGYHCNASKNPEDNPVPLVQNINSFVI